MNYILNQQHTYYGNKGDVFEFINGGYLNKRTGIRFANITIEHNGFFEPIIEPPETTNKDFKCPICEYKDIVFDNPPCDACHQYGNFKPKDKPTKIFYSSDNTIWLRGCFKKCYIRNVDVDSDICRMCEYFIKTDCDKTSQYHIHCWRAKEAQGIESSKEPKRIWFTDSEWEMVRKILGIDNKTAKESPEEFYKEELKGKSTFYDRMLKIIGSLANQCIEKDTIIEKLETELKEARDKIIELEKYKEWADKEYSKHTKTIESLKDLKNDLEDKNIKLTDENRTLNNNRKEALETLGEMRDLLNDLRNTPQ